MPTDDVAGKPAAECPYCGCRMYVNGTPYKGETVIFRYVECRNCGKSFRTKQPTAVILYEVKEATKSNDVSSSGSPQLTVFRETA